MSHSYWLALGICLSACGSDPDDSERCSDGLAVFVRPAVQPEFVWSPSGCLASSISVAGFDGEVWALIDTSGVNGIESPVRYGQPPSSGQVERGGLPLEPDSNYEVVLRRVVDGEERPVGVRDFVQQSAP